MTATDTADRDVKSSGKGKRKPGKSKKPAEKRSSQLTAEKLAAYEKWRADNAATFEHEAFGSVWDVPQSWPAAVWINRPSWAGKPFREIEPGEAIDMARCVLGPDVFDSWVELNVPFEEFFREVGVVFARKAEMANGQEAE